MKKPENKNLMTVAYNAFGASKPVTPFVTRSTSVNRSVDPSSSVRADRYPLPTSFEYCSYTRERGIA